MKEVVEEVKEELFPAYAGVILILLKSAIEILSVPRIRGGDPSSLCSWV